MKKAEQVLRDALAMTGMVIPLTSTGRGGSVEFLCRQIPGQEASWLSVVEALLRWGDEKSNVKDRLFIARRYLLKDGKMVFGWFVGIDMPSAGKLQDACKTMAELISNHQPELSPAVSTPQPSRTPVKASPAVGAPSIRVISKGTDGEGKDYEVTEMPLPHVTRDLNAPTAGSTKGAFLHGKAPIVGRRT